MRRLTWAILLTLALASPALAVSTGPLSGGSGTYSIDAFGRVSFTGVAAGSTVTKNGVSAVNADGSAATVSGGGTWTDLRPQKNYRKKTLVSGDFSGTRDLSTQTINCVEFGLIYTRITDHLVWDVTVDGGTATRVDLDLGGNRAGTQTDQILWGQSGLTAGNHTITLHDVYDWYYPQTYLKGIWYSDLSVAYGDPITYAFSDGQSVTISPRPDRAAAAQSMVNRFIASYSSATWDTPWVCEIISTIAGMYRATGDSRLIAIAKAGLDNWKTKTDRSTGRYIHEDGNADILVDGRTAHNLYYAYKIFGDSAYLTEAELITGYFRNDWPTSSNVWSYNSTGGYVDGQIPNQITSACLGAAELYNEPASVSYYHDSTLLAKALASATSAVSGGYLTSDGKLKYSYSQAYYEHGYGAFEYLPLRYLHDNFGWTATGYDNIAAWLTIGTGEPYFIQSEFYGYWSPSWTAFRPIYDPTGFDPTDTLFSAAFDNPHISAENSGADPDYYPAGFTASTAGYTNTNLLQQGLPFYAYQYYEALGIDLPVAVPPATVVSITGQGATGGIGTLAASGTSPGDSTPWKLASGAADTATRKIYQGGSWVATSAPIKSYQGGTWQ